jgi:hypothetical protein
MVVNFDRLQTPQLVTDMLDRLGPDVDRAHWEVEFKLSYYYGGLLVAAERGRDGLRVVASGPAAEVGAVLDSLPPGAADRLVILTPDPLADHLASLPRVREAAVP